MRPLIIQNIPSTCFDR